ncbi:hypothetical protein EMIHUDRAFT_194107 [Emiliania huxleyi CCMP1516]|uniref:Uncharacterized protein n=2 Tax=Emiliania huxleyi TaxID=2903 RepID=A0A0D3L0Z5_EMIH1|nr:hypothetical protein EMIHUDRAFT_194107 [Emiliania huxleyi CCMP1516]EOD41680.1 hypothetical protein EMIHUDRAFT_194107 [Emiliania huxleyi CCMP1516]|eukprot:XP_005794109.1 hypothetical protein EMIHUDRAFT_194107 [Emiliania huxleyi CCMP1516]
MGEPVPPRWAGQRLARAGHSGGAAASSRSSSARPPLGVAASDGDGAWLRADVLPERVWRQQQLLARRLRRGSTILRKQGFVGRVFVERCASLTTPALRSTWPVWYWGWAALGPAETAV